MATSTTSTLTMVDSNSNPRGIPSLKLAPSNWTTTPYSQSPTRYDDDSQDFQTPRTFNRRTHSPMGGMQIREPLVGSQNRWSTPNAGMGSPYGRDTSSASQDLYRRSTQVPGRLLRQSSKLSNRSTLCGSIRRLSLVPDLGSKTGGNGVAQGQRTSRSPPSPGIRFPVNPSGASSPGSQRSPGLQRTHTPSLDINNARPPPLEHSYAAFSPNGLAQFERSFSPYNSTPSSPIRSTFAAPGDAAKAIDFAPAMAVIIHIALAFFHSIPLLFSTALFLIMQTSTLTHLLLKQLLYTSRVVVRQGLWASALVGRHSWDWLRWGCRTLWKKSEKMRDHIFFEFMVWILNPHALALLIFWPGWVLIVGIYGFWSWLSSVDAQVEGIGYPMLHNTTFDTYL